MEKNASESQPTNVLQNSRFDWMSWTVAAGGGAAGALAFVPVAWWFLAPLAPLAFFIVLRNAPTPGAAFRRLLFGGWIFYFGSVQWLLTIRVYAPAEWLGVFGIVLLGVYMSLWIALPMWAVRKWIWPYSAGAQIFVFGSVWILSEWLRTLGRFANPISLIGHAWAEQPSLIQVASSLGELGVSLEVLLIAGLIYYWAFAFRSGANRAAMLYASAGSVVLAALMISNIALLSKWNTNVAESAPKPHINVAIVQPYIEQQYKLASYAYPDEAVRRQLSTEIAKRNEQLVNEYRKPDWQLVVMPETAYTERDFFKNEPAQQIVRDLAKKNGVDILFGADRDTTPALQIFNSAFMARADGTLDRTTYDKMRLVPFAESLPYLSAFPWFQESVVGMGGTLAEGSRPELFESHGMRFGVLICFESTFSQMGRMIAREGADFFAVITNDAWYGMSAGPKAHFNLSLLRAVETRRWIVRSANTGISGVITPAGTVEQSLALGRMGVVSAAIPKVEGARATFFMRWGNTWLISAAALVLITAGWNRRKKPGINDE